MLSGIGRSRADGHRGAIDAGAVDTEHLFGFTEGTSIGAAGEGNKGRDLVDLAHALEISTELKAQKTVDMFVEYVKQKLIPRREVSPRRDFTPEGSMGPS